MTEENFKGEMKPNRSPEQTTQFDRMMDPTTADELNVDKPSVRMDRYGNEIIPRARRL